MKAFTVIKTLFVAMTIAITMGVMTNEVSAQPPAGIYDVDSIISPDYYGTIKFSPINPGSNYGTAKFRWITTPSIVHKMTWTYVNNVLYVEYITPGGVFGYIKLVRLDSGDWLRIDGGGTLPWQHDNSYVAFYK